MREYFDFAEATAELVETGHLVLTEEGYAITEKGRESSAACESSLPFSVRRRCDEALMEVNAVLRRKAQVRGEVREADGVLTAWMCLDDEGGSLMTLELTCPTREQAQGLVEAFQARPERVYQRLLESLTREEEA